MIRTHYAHMDRGVPEVRIRTIGIRDLQIALRQGWEDFMDRRGDLVFVGFIYPIVGFLAVAIALNWTLLPIFFPLVAGLTLLGPAVARSEEHTSELQSLMRISYAVFCLKKKHMSDTIRSSTTHTPLAT